MTENGLCWTHIFHVVYVYKTDTLNVAITSSNDLKLLGLVGWMVDEW